MAKNGSDPSEAVDQSSSSIAMGVRGVAQRRASPTRVWECLAAAASGDVRGLLESEAGNGAGLLDNMAVSGTRGRPAVERAGGTGGEVEAGLACKRLLVEAGAFERFGYSEMAVACSRSVLQVGREDEGRGITIALCARGGFSGLERRALCGGGWGVHHHVCRLSFLSGASGEKCSATRFGLTQVKVDGKL